MGIFKRLLGSKPSPADSERLNAILREMLSAPSTAALKRIFDRSPEALSSEFEALLERWLPAQTDPRATELLKHCLNLVRLCRQHGVETVFTHMVETRPLQGYDLDIPSLLDEPLEALIDLAEQARQDPALHKQRIELIDDLLKLLPAGRFSALQALLLNERGIAYQNLPGGSLPQNLEKAIESYREALEYNDPQAAPSQHAIVQVNLGTVYARLTSGSLTANLERAIACYREALGYYTPQSAPQEYGKIQANLGSAYSKLPSGERAANLRQAIAYFQEALQYLSPQESPLEYGMTLNYLGGALRELPSGERRANLEQALDYHQKALPFFSPQTTPFEFAATQVFLGGVFAKMPTGDLSAHLEAAQGYFAKALEFFTPENYPYFYALIKTGLGDVYTNLPTGDRSANLQQAIVCIRAALDIYTPQAFPWEYALAQNSLGGLLSELPAGDRGENLAQAIACFEEALAVFTPENNPFQYATTHNNLGNVYYRLLTGDRGANLQQAIDHYREALRFQSLDSSPWEYAGTQTNLGIVYRNLPAGDRTANLHQSIACYREALKVFTAEAAPARYSGVQNNLGIAFENLPTGDRVDNLEQAIASYQEALRFRTPETAPDEYAESMHNLGNAYSRFKSGERPDSLRHAIDSYREALRFWTRENRPTDYANLQVNLGNAYAASPASDQPGNMEEAIACFREALQVYTPQSAPLMYASALDHLGSAYSRMQSGDREANRQQAIGFYREALRYSPLEMVPADHRSTARRLGNLYFEAEEWEPAHVAFEAAIAAGEMLYQAAATGVSRQVELEAAGELFADDAYCLARSGRLPASVERLEAGRARSLAEALARNHAALEAARPGDQADYRQARQRLEALEMEARSLSSPGVDSGPVRSFVEISGDLAQARQMLAQVVERIRQELPEFMPARLDFADIAGAALEDTPLVYLISTLHGSLALVVPPGSGKAEAAHAVWLEAFNSEDLDNLLVQDGEGGKLTSYLAGQVWGEAEILQPALDRVLPILKERLAASVEARLLALGLRRAALVPGGLLALLPLQAAFESATISYAPSARALQSAHQAATERGGLPPILLAAANPLPNPRPLDFARPEVEAIASLFQPDSNRLLFEGQATGKALMEALPGATHLHFACHGAFDLEEPLDSALSLSGDDALKLRDLLDGDLDLSQSRLAVLSACQTGISDFQRVPDEAVGLPAGFLQAGVPGVVSTLWPVEDISTALLLTRFYQYYLRDGQDPTSALHQAQSWLREVTAGELAAQFSAERRRLEGESSVTYDQISQAWRQFIRLPASARPFAHPFYWAAFTFTGV